MDNLKRMAILVAVVEHGSIRRAARELEITPSAVSQHLRKLEDEVGVHLLQRTTRSLALTEAGEAFHEGCLAMVAGAKRATEGLAALHDTPVGELRVSSPAGFAAGHLVEALAPLLAVHPRLSLHLLVTEDPVDFVRDRVDLAISIARPLRNSNALRRHLADWPLVLCGSPEYFLRRGHPRTPADLAHHDFLTLPSGHHPTDVLTGPRGQQYRVAVKPRVVSDNHFVLRQLTLHGGGLSFNVEPEVAADLAAGRLVEVLPAWHPHTLSLDALLPPRAAHPAKVRVAVQALRAYVATLPRRAAPREARAGAPRRP